MNCIILINGREAIPIRALPFVTGWELSPDVLAIALAQDGDWSDRLKRIRAHCLAPDGSHSEMLPKEFDGSVVALRVLSASLKAAEVLEGDSYPAWREQSPSKLPSHCFVWRDEFEPAARYAMAALMSLDEERPGDNDLNFSPHPARAGGCGA